MHTISVLMPMRNAERYVEQAVRSVLDQEGVELELVIIDDGSTDASAEIVRSFDDRRIRLLPGPQRGIAAAMNRALAAARGAFISRCDADDYYLPGRLRSQLEWLLGHQKYGVVCGAFAVLSPGGEVLAELECGGESREVTDEVRRGMLRASFNTYLTRATVARAVGPFREFFISGSDVDYQLRLADVCRTYFQACCRYAYRLHDESITHTQAAPQRIFYESVARQMQKQRQQFGIDDIDRGHPPRLPKVPQTDAAPSTAAEHMQGILLGHAWREHRSGRRLAALRTGVRALAANPRQLSSWRSVAALAVKPTGGQACIAEAAAERTAGV